MIVAVEDTVSDSERERVAVTQPVPLALARYVSEHRVQFVAPGSAEKEFSSLQERQRFMQPVVMFGQ